MRARSLNRYTSVRELNLKKQNYIFIEIQGFRQFLIGRNLNDLPKVFQLVIEEEVKNSVSRQITDYVNKGKLPQQYRKEVRTYYAKKLETIPHGNYRVLEML